MVSSLTPRIVEARRVHAHLVSGDRRVDAVEDDAPFFGILVRVERRDLAGLLELRAFVHDQRGVAAIVHDEGGTAAVRPLERFARAPPVFVESFTLPGEHRRAFRILHRAARFGTSHDDGGGSVILRREDVAGDPADVGAKLGRASR